MSVEVQKELRAVLEVCRGVAASLAMLAAIEQTRAAREKRLWYEKDDEGLITRAHIIAVLEAHESFCMDNAAEREALADALLVAFSSEGGA